MDLRIQLASVVVGLLIWCLVVFALRRARLYPSYAVLWMLLGSLLIFLPFYAGLLRWAAGHVFGIVGANHLIYAMLFAFVLVYLFYLTQKICQLTNRMERAIVALAIVEGRFIELAAARGVACTPEPGRGRSVLPGEAGAKPSS
jgi:hypothetical protein